MAEREHTSEQRLICESGVYFVSNSSKITIVAGAVIRMYPYNHHPAHVHAEYAEYEAVIDIKTCEIKSGTLPARIAHEVIQWVCQHRQELLDSWNKVLQGQYPDTFD
ncbi:MAG: transcriptional regulator [Sulfobacillus acidophilus]|uniref:Transcriptional regulator n=1 Tax=Sulfobacillus acidophilus TaxID=53633 RepID=A0A2T2WCS2_9FIRM|nr:MAG: transcriptional regulator [Sulfobacillus acidophilus]